MALHPYFAELSAQLSALPPRSAGTPEVARKAAAAARPRYGRGPELEDVRDVPLPLNGTGGHGRLYLPRDAGPGVILFLHGGGWVIGTADDYDSCLRLLAQETGMPVLFVDYRLAPEAPWPAAVDDCRAALQAVLKGGIQGLQPGPVVLMGDSAGGNLAAVLSNELTEAGPVVLQVLVYPATDCDFTRPSYDSFGQGLPLTTADMHWFFNHYVPDPQDRTNPAVSPLRHPTPGGPGIPALVLVAEYDVLKDEGIAYYEALKAAGCPAQLLEAQGLPHNFFRFSAAVPVAGAELSRIAEEIRRVTGRAQPL